MYAETLARICLGGDIGRERDERNFIVRRIQFFTTIWIKCQILHQVSLISAFVGEVRGNFNHPVYVSARIKSFSTSIMSLKTIKTFFSSLLHILQTYLSCCSPQLC